MLRDRLMVGIRDVILLERLKMDSELNLEKAMKMVRQKEAVHEHNSQLQGKLEIKDSGNLSLLKQKNVSTPRQGIPPQRREMGTKKTKSKCTRCRKTTHKRGEQCPAINITCHKCKRKGHFAFQCFSKTVKAANDEISLDSSFLDAMMSESQTSWSTELLLEKTGVNFKLDTGAEVTAVTEETFNLLRGIKLSKPYPNLSMAQPEKASMYLASLQERYLTGRRHLAKPFT